MVTEGDEAAGGIARFSLETERMPDGRRIHYYSWPGEAAPAGEPDGAAAPAARPSDPSEEELG